jgi:mannose-6-phosphate isomerase-like protein (cupin superfamily)
MKIAAFSVVLAAALVAADPAGFVQFPGKDLKGFEKKLASKVNEKKVATEQLGKFGNHSFMVAHREGPGEAELHETQADVFIVQSGEATLVVGGTVDQAKTTAPNEVRGPSIAGGEKKKLGAGDVVHIPAKTAHQVLVDAGKQLTYMVVKIDSK